MLIILLLILAVILALGMTLFATQNPSHVDVVIAGMRWEDVPLYLVVLLSLLLGLTIAWGFGLISSISSSLTIFGKDLKINKNNQIVNQLNKKIESLEAENANLKAKPRPV